MILGDTRAKVAAQAKNRLRTAKDGCVSCQADEERFMRNGMALQAVRTLFFSDVHLGSRYCNPSLLLQLIEQTQAEAIYVVGDFCDGWLLRRRWRWPRDYQLLVDALLRCAAEGTQVYYLLGNHDRCLQRWIAEWGELWIGEQRVHRCADGRRLLVIHGDQFDSTQCRFRGMAKASAVLHEQFLGSGRIANRMLAEIGINHSRLATAMTYPFKSVAHSLGQLHARSKQLADLSECQGILFGHTHTPMIKETQDFVHLNCGDWLEHCSAIVETHSGQLELWLAPKAGWAEGARRIAVSPARGRPTLIES